MGMRMRLCLAAVLALGQLAAGLNFTFTGNCTDTDRRNMNITWGDLAYFNTTGTTQFTPRAVSGNDEPWYYYLTLQDGSQTGGRPSFIYRWLGVPLSFLDSDQGSRTSLCMWSSRGYDKDLKKTQGNDTCDGVISSKCAKAYSDGGANRSADRCASLDTDLAKECQVSSTSSTGLLSRESGCFVTSLPGVDVPEGYGVMMLIGISYGEEKDKGTRKPYDEAVRQSIASFFTFVEEDDKEFAPEVPKVLATQPVCAIPNVVQRDSRPVDSAGERLPPPTVVALAVAVVSFVLNAAVL